MRLARMFVSVSIAVSGCAATGSREASHPRMVRARGTDDVDGRGDDHQRHGLGQSPPSPFIFELRSRINSTDPCVTVSCADGGLLVLGCADPTTRIASSRWPSDDSAPTILEWITPPRVAEPRAAPSAASVERTTTVYVTAGDPAELVAPTTDLRSAWDQPARRQVDEERCPGVAIETLWLPERAGSGSRHARHDGWAIALHAASFTAVLVFDPSLPLVEHLLRHEVLENQIQFAAIGAGSLSSTHAASLLSARLRTEYLFLAESAEATCTELRQLVFDYSPALWAAPCHRLPCAVATGSSLSSGEIRADRQLHVGGQRFLRIQWPTLTTVGFDGADACF